MDVTLFNTIVETITPYLNDPEDRQTLVERALFGSPVLAQLDWTGKPLTFTTRLVRQLHLFDVTALVDVLSLLKKEVGGSKQAEIEMLIAQLAPTATPSNIVSSPTTSSGFVFISYARKNLDFVQRLRADLQQRQIAYWLDQEGLTPGTGSWERAIRTALRGCRAVLWVVSPASYDSPYVRDEIAIARMNQHPLFPLWAEGTNWLECVPLGTSEVQYADMRGANYATGLAQLLAALSGNQPAPTIQPTSLTPIPAQFVPRNPYKGLAAFQETDSRDFFGRSALIERLVARVQAQLTPDQPRWLAVLGPSGAGKSSVVMAGLIPALKQGKIKGSEQWTYLPRIVPGAHPMETLADALHQVLPNTALSTLELDLNSPSPRMLHRLIHPLPGARVVLYIDQFEELFTLTKSVNERQQFVQLLTDAALEPTGKLLVLLSMRGDYLDHPTHYPPLGNLFRDCNELIQPLTIAELYEAIESPAQLDDVRLEFEAGLVGDIVFELRERSAALQGALPFLEFTLQCLFEQRAGVRLTKSAYQQMGGVAGAIGTHAETLFQRLPAEVQDSLGTVFLPLTNIDPNTGEPTRRRASRRTLASDESAAARLLNTLIDGRLLLTGQDSEEQDYVEVAHEALFRSWERLKTWIAETQEDLILLRQVRSAAQEWQAKNRPNFLLWPQERLVLVYAMQARLKSELNDIEQAFIEPEQARLLRELETLPYDDSSHERRRDIGDRLAVIGDTRAGVGVKEGLPDVVWLPVTPGGEIQIEDKTFHVQPFYIAKYPITYAQFETFLQAEDGFENDDWWAGLTKAYQKQKLSTARSKLANTPRDSVSWYQVVAFARWMDAKYRMMGLFAALPPLTPNPSPPQVGRGESPQWQIRLPTEWEWQWAAQGGATTKQYPWGAWKSGYSNTSETGLSRTVAVGMYIHSAAECGSLDMIGNLWEWCLNDRDTPEVTDAYSSDSCKVLRGGSFNLDHNYAIVSYRDDLYPSFSYYYCGVRLVVAPRLL